MLTKHCPQYELRELIFSLLSGNVILSGAVVPVYESVPRELPRPYIVVGKAAWVPDEAKNYNIDMYLLDINMFTDYGGTLENVEILDGVYAALSRALNTGTLQFDEDSFFRIGLAYFEGGNTEVVGNNDLFPELLEQSSLQMSFKIEQTR